jgi:hypothetical protein
MKRVLTLGLLAGLLALASGAALAGGGHGHSRVVVGFNFGYPVYAPWYYYPAYYPAPYYYYPPAYVSPPAPTQYVERNDVAPEAAPAPSMWYFCRDANAYYPYVKQCPGGWQRVPAQPSN